MASIVSFEHVSKAYHQVQALDDINLQIHSGEFVTIIGSSGCGKTTLLKLINGLLKPDSGHIFVDQLDLSSCDLIDLRRKCGYVIQGIGLFPHLNIAKNISYVLNISHADQKLINEQVLKMLEIVGLDTDVLERYPSELSGGQQQRVGIARALAAHPKMMLMDEPFGAVDEITRRSLQAAIKHIHQTLNMTIIFVTHDIKEALRLGTRVIVMDQAHIIQDDLPSNIIKNPATDFVAELINEE